MEVKVLFTMVEVFCLRVKGNGGVVAAHATNVKTQTKTMRYMMVE
jgi:hypothetical protein